MTITKAFRELESIRNNRTSTLQELQERVDTVGHWAAKQKWSKKVAKLHEECHELFHQLQGDSTGNTGVKLNIIF